MKLHLKNIVLDVKLLYIKIINLDFKKNVKIINLDLKERHAK